MFPSAARPIAVDGGGMDIIMQGIDAALRKRGYPPVEDLKGGEKRLIVPPPKAAPPTPLRAPGQPM